MRRQTPKFSASGNQPGNVVSVPLTQLTTGGSSPRRFKNEEVDRAASFIERYADKVLPIVATTAGCVLTGEIFVEAARRLGVKALWVVQQDLLSEADALLYSVAAGRLLELGRWDAAVMEVAVRTFESQIEDFSPSYAGFAPGELDKVLGVGTAGGDADMLPKLSATAVTKPGGIWCLDAHRVLCGNATDEAAVELLMHGREAAAASVDMPFGCGINGFVAKAGLHREFVEGSGDKSDDELYDLFFKAFVALSKVLKPGAIVFAYIDWRSLALMQRAGERVFGKILNLCVWAKDRAGMGSHYRSQHELVLVFRKPGAAHMNNIQLGKHGRNRSNVWSFPAAASIRKGREADMLKHHPTPKTVEMVVESILDCTARGAIVIDTFLGSGTTLIAAERSGRTCYGMDLDPLYIDVAIRRWQSWTGRQAIDSTTGATFDELALLAQSAEASDGQR